MKEMNKNEKIIFIFILSVLALGLIFTAFNRYRFYQEFITIPVEKWEHSNVSKSDIITDNEIYEGNEKTKINLNKAGINALISLPGIGRHIALNIIDYRTRHGEYRRLEDLLKVKGIGAKKLEKIRDHITVR